MSKNPNANETGQNDETQPDAEDNAASAPPEVAPDPSPAAEKPPEDELPEDIELTPEIVEDEAIRNDFMLRLAVVLLAVLVACTEISETTTLVHVKTGQYLGSHGVLPPRTDVFAHTTAESPWINLNWFFDLVSAAVFALGGAIGLTVVKALLAGAVFFVLFKVVKRDVPTWWSSICAGLALLACAREFTFEPQLITLLGLTLTLLAIVRWAQETGTANLWLLLPVFIVWSNMDPRAYLGLVVLMLLTLGELLGMLAGRSFLNNEANRGHLWVIVPAAILVFMIHPFGWHSLLSPANLYVFEYPAWRELLANSAEPNANDYLPLTDIAIWKNLTLPTIAGLVLAAVVPVCFALNWRNVSPAHGLLYLGLVGIGLANHQDLAAVSLVFAVLAALNAQEWYAESFRQSYSVELSERLFSVGGRAVTAFALIGIAFLGITGRLLGQAENRLGLGFDQDLANQIDVVKEDLEETEIPGNGLNLRVAHGDVLIWLDAKPFIDSRLNLFARGGSDSVFADFIALSNSWNSLPPKEEETQEDYTKRVLDVLDLRQENLQKYEIAHAVVPLGPHVAEYGRLIMLQADPSNWRLVRLSAMAGWFYRLDPEQEPDLEYLREHIVSFVDEAFQNETDTTPNQPIIATAPTLTDKVFATKSGKANSPKMLLALHYRRLMNYRLGLITQFLSQQGRLNMDESFQAMSLGYLSIRQALAALAEDASSVMAHQILADGVMDLSRLEYEVGRFIGVNAQTNRDRRYYQAVASYSQAIVADPENPNLHLELGRIFQRSNRLDLALREFEKFLELSGPPEDDDETVIENYERRMRIKKDIEAAVEQVQLKVDEAIENKAPVREIAAFAQRNGCTLMAIKLLEQEGEFPQNDPAAQMWRLEAGQVEDVYLAMLHMESQLEASSKSAAVKQFGLAPQSQIHHFIAMASLAVGDYERAISHWTEQAEEAEQLGMLNMLGTLPMANRPVDASNLFLRVGDDWGFAGWFTGAALVTKTPQDAALPLLNAALCYLEIGQAKKAAELFKQMLEVHPETEYRPLAAFYIALATEEQVELISPREFIPIWHGMFAESPAVAEKPETKE